MLRLAPQTCLEPRARRVPSGEIRGERIGKSPFTAKLVSAKFGIRLNAFGEAIAGSRVFVTTRRTRESRWPYPAVRIAPSGELAGWTMSKMLGVEGGIKTRCSVPP